MPVLRYTPLLSGLYLCALSLFAASGVQASTVVVCELQGRALAASVAASLKPVDAKSPALAGTSFPMQVAYAARPKTGRADSDCTHFVDSKVDVLLHVPLFKPLTAGDAVSVRYRYMDGRAGMSMTSYELIDRP